MYCKIMLVHPKYGKENGTLKESNTEKSNVPIEKKERCCNFIIGRAITILGGIEKS